MPWRERHIENKKRHEAEELKKTHKWTSFFSILVKKVADAIASDASLSFLLVENSADAVGVTLFLKNGKEATVGSIVRTGIGATTEGKADFDLESIPNDFNLFGGITYHLREKCIRLGTSHFQNLTVALKQSAIARSGSFL